MAGQLRRRVGSRSLELLQGDITSLDVDAIVNAANTRLQLGAGVAGAIRRRGGPSIQQECNEIGHCPVGDAVVTGAGALRARYVIHAVGPVWADHTPDEADRLLASACRRALERARELGLETLALPALSTGVYGFPLPRAARLLVREAVRHLQGPTTLERVIFCLFDEEAFEAFVGALEEILPAAG